MTVHDLVMRLLSCYGMAQVKLLDNAPNSIGEPSWIACIVDIIEAEDRNTVTLVGKMKC